MRAAAPGVEIEDTSGSFRSSLDLVSGVLAFVVEHTREIFTSVDWSCYGVWALTVTLMITGLIGSVVPLLPGPLLIFAAAAVHVLLRPQTGVTWWCVAFMAVLTVVSYALDFASGAMGTRWFGGSRWGMVGVVLGGLVGMFFSLPGLIIGPLVGGFVFEMLFAKKQVHKAVKSTWGVVVGTGMGLVLRLMVALAMVASFFIDAFWM